LRVVCGPQQCTRADRALDEPRDQVVGRAERQFERDRFDLDPCKTCIAQQSGEDDVVCELEEGRACPDSRGRRNVRVGDCSEDRREERRAFRGVPRRQRDATA
jgi:hypothetical protein